MHLDQEHIERLLHGELPAAARQGMREHLAGCDRCRERLDSARRDEAEIFALFRQVDHPPPTVSAEAVADRARSAGLVWGRWAAGILMVVGLAGAAYAAPGSPLRDWVRSAAAWIGVSEPSRREPMLTEPPAARVAGISAQPGPEFVIDFKAPEPGGEAHVSLTTGTEVTVRAPVGAASFTSAAARLVIDNSSSGATYEIEIPRTARRVEIRVAGKRLFLKEGLRVVSRSPIEARSRYSILLSLSP
jgi:hypothetical protein